MGQWTKVINIICETEHSTYGMFICVHGNRTGRKRREMITSRVVCRGRVGIQKDVLERPYR